MMNNEDQIENDVKTEGPKVHLGRERDEIPAHEGAV